MRKLLYFTLGISTLFIILISVIVLQMKADLERRLSEKRFLPPTQYFSAPKKYSTETLAGQNELLQELKKRNYRERSLDDRLSPGDYATGRKEDCARISPTELPLATSSCVLIAIKTNQDPFLADSILQLATFDMDQKFLTAYKGNPLLPATELALEPLLIAQYLGKQPITQTYTPLGQIPTSCLNAVLAIEDVHFLEHSGVSITGILRALLKNILAGGRYAQGGSTITQQMVKNYFLTPEKSIVRKVKEIVMSVLLESTATKDEIFETYLNIIYLGQNGPYQIRGFAAASQYYFQKPIENLELAECATIAAILNSPGLFDPFKKPANSIKRRNLVLDKMYEYKFISKAQLDSAKALSSPTPNTFSINETAPYYIDAAQKEIEELNLNLEGLIVFTGLDPQAQKFAQEAVIEEIKKLENENKTIKALAENKISLEGVLLSADNSSGEIRALVGGRNYKMTQFNRAIDGHRQVGSIMKPFVFLSALIYRDKPESRNALSPLQDVRFTHTYEKQKWSPENYGKKYFGQVPMYFALKNSLNSATASLGIEVGLDKIISTAQSAGVYSSLQKVPSLTLGAFELYPKEVLQSYLTLANLGQFIKVSTLRALVNDSNQIIYQKSKESKVVLSPEPTSELVGMMKQTVQSGTAKKITDGGFQYPAAGKTGTTSDNKDSWFAGFTAQTTTVSWVGFDDNSQSGLTGASAAVPIWLSFMKQYQTQFLNKDFNFPETVLRRKISDLPNENHEIELIFSK